MTDKKRILIVDDQPSNIRILNEILGTEYNISIATNGKDALQVCEAHPPDLILLDIIMPKMDGYEVCVKLKKNRPTSKIPIIFVTAMGEVEDETKGLNIGAVDFIRKPVNPSIVRARVKTHIRLKIQQDQLKQSISILEHEKEILQQKAELGIQAGGLAHDINNVLAAIMIVQMIPELLPEDLEERSTIEEFIDMASESLDLGRSICQGYTSYLQDNGEQGRVQSVLPLLQPLGMYSRRFRGQLIKDFENDIPPIFCKGSQIKRVIVNIFTNACQAIENQKDQVIIARIWADDHKVYFSLHDNGPGIPDDALSQIFNECFTTKKTGTGLGLFLVKSIVKAHNGSIEVQTGPEQGTKFIVSFPAVQEEMM